MFDQNKQQKIINKIQKLKKENREIQNYTTKQLMELPIINGALEFNFNKKKFNMINIFNDDYIPLIYLWRGKYENFSLDIWYNITRNNGWFIDVGAHTGIYTIIGNLDKKINQIISFEPYFINYCRLILNLRLNEISANNCILGALSNEGGHDKIYVSKPKYFHSQGGFISEKGNVSISKYTLDNFQMKENISGMKIDTEGHEYEVLLGSQNIIKKNKPDIILEINEKSFDLCFNLLNKLDYSFYKIDEKTKKLLPIKEYSSELKTTEGTNALATINKNIKKFL